MHRSSSRLAPWLGALLILSAPSLLGAQENGAPPNDPPPDGGPSATGDLPPPVPIHTPAPEVPEDLRARLGRIDVRGDFVVDESGRPRDIRLRGTSDEELLSLLGRTLSEWRFEPYEVDGERVEIPFTMSFELPAPENRPEPEPRPEAEGGREPPEPQQ